MIRSRFVFALLGLVFCTPQRSAWGGDAAHQPASFAGTDDCVRCHQRQGDAWSTSPHGRHAVAVASPEGGADGAVGSSWMQAYFRKDERGRYRIAGRCFDIREQRWRSVATVLDAIAGVNSGLDAVTDEALALRSFDFDCSGCHASQTEFRTTRSDGHAGAEWREGSINCEACHGPGGEHTRRWDKLSPAAPLARLDRLTPRASNAICTRCHGGPPVTADFTPADAVHHIARIEDRAGMFPDGTASGQIYQDAGFSRSPCFTEGGLRCVDCHDAHRGGLRQQPHADALCTRCHDGYGNRAHTHHAATGAGARCIECHMPKLLGGILAHQRDHRLRSPLPASPHVPDACTACHKDKDKRWASAAYEKWWGKPPRADLSAIDAIAAARRKHPAARPGLVRALDHDDPYFRANAALLLADPEPVLEDPSPAVRLAAVTAAAHSTDPERFLLLFAKDKEPLVRAAAIRNLVRNGEPLREEWVADLRLGQRHDRGQPVVSLMLGLRAVEMEREEEARVLLERAAVMFAEKPEANARALGIAWRALARVASASVDANAAHLRSAQYFRAYWRGSPRRVDSLVDAVRELVAGDELDAARTLLRDEIPSAADARTRSMLRELLVQLKEKSK